MVLPGLLRDGVCGLVSCADVTPEVAVGRPEGTGLAVVVPEDAAGELGSLRLFEITGSEETSREDPVIPGTWVVQRTDPDALPTVVPFGEEPDGFETLTELDAEPTAGLWVIEASFGCASTLVRFDPQELDPGFVTTGDEPVTIGDFERDARGSLRCATDAPGWQRWLFALGAAAAAVGAVLGIVVVFRSPVRDDRDWYDDEPI